MTPASDRPNRLMELLTAPYDTDLIVPADSARCLLELLSTASAYPALRAAATLKKRIVHRNSGDVGKCNAEVRLTERLSVQT